MFMKCVVPCIAIIMQWFIAAETARIAKKIVIIEDFNNCPDVDEKEMHLKLISAKFGMTSGSHSTLSVKTYVDENVTEALMITATIYKCPSLHGEEDCEKLLSISLKDFCSKILETNQAWSFVFANLEPQLKCPISEGYYEVKEAEPDLEKLKWLIDDYHVYRIRIAIYRENDKTMVACIFVVVRSNVVRVYTKD